MKIDLVSSTHTHKQTLTIVSKRHLKTPDGGKRRMSRRRIKKCFQNVIAAHLNELIPRPSTQTDDQVDANTDTGTHTANKGDEKIETEHQTKRGKTHVP